MEVGRHPSRQHHVHAATGFPAILPDRFELPFSGPKPDMIDRYIMGVKLLPLSRNIGGDIISPLVEGEMREGKGDKCHAWKSRSWSYSDTFFDRENGPRPEL